MAYVYAHSVLCVTLLTSVGGVIFFSLKIKQLENILPANGSKCRFYQNLSIFDPHNSDKHENI